MSLDKILSAINKKYGEGTLLKASDAKSLVVDRVSTGIFDLDLKIGGGIPRGRITTLKGEYSTGKSAVCLKLAAQAQRCDRLSGKPFVRVNMDGSVNELDHGRKGEPAPMRVVWLDAEHSFDPDWAAKWGVDTDSIYVIQTEYAEQAIDVADACIRSKECDLLVVDSVAALTPGVEVEQSSEKWQVGVAARLMNKAMRKWTSGMNSAGLLAETKCSIVMINQMRLNLGGYHPTPTSPGGKGIDFFQSVEVRFKRTEWVEDPVLKRGVGIDVEFGVRKNKTAPANGGGKFRLFFNPSESLGYKTGDTDNDTQVLRSAVFWALLKKGGAWFTFPDGKRVQGENAAARLLRTQPELIESLKKQVFERELAWIESGKADGVVMPDTTEKADGEDSEGA